MRRFLATHIARVVGLSLLFSFVAAPLAEPVLAKRNDKATVEPSELNMKEGLIKMKMGDYEGAEDNFLQAVYFSRNHYNPQAYLMLGLSRKATRKYAKAIEAFKEHLKQVTEPSPNGRIDLAECYMEVGKMEEAKAEVEKAASEADWKDKRPMYAMGKLCERLGEVGLAKGHYYQALGDRPWTYTEAWMGLARCYVKMKDYNEALKEYRAIISSAVKRVDWVELYYNMGQCLYQRGDHQGAIDHWLYALKENPDSFECHLALGSIFDEEKHISSAVKSYENAIRCAPKGYDTNKIDQRLLFLQSKLQQKEAAKPVRPSPFMRQEQQDAQNAMEKQAQQSKIPAESGF